jgi:putative transposase
MPRRIRATAGGLVYHVLNRGVGRMRLFRKAADFAAMEQVLEEAVQRTKTRLLAYCLMSNHWHLLFWPREDGELSEVMRWLTVTHTQRWHANRHTSGTGPIYQGRFKSFPVESDDHLLTVVRYVERNALRANLVERAADWQWCSLWRRCQGDAAILSDWPVPIPKKWSQFVERPQTGAELEAIRRSVARGRPFGNDCWAQRTAKQFSLESTFRPQGRPRKKPAP